MALSVVYPPKGSEVALAIDIVAVHGLGGDAIDTWTHPQSGAFWLKDFLPKEISDARILTFGYNAAAAFGSSTAGFRDYAKGLLASLVDKRERAEEQVRPLVFVAHSLGGIVVKQALMSACIEPRYRSIYDSTIGIVFFGTPHQGSEKAAYGTVLAAIAQTILHRPTSPLLNALQTNSPDLQKLTTDFRHQQPRYQVVSFYEQHPVKPFKNLIVEQHSALLQVNNEEQLPVDADHIAMCKFASGEDSTYEKTWKRINRMRPQTAQVTAEANSATTEVAKAGAALRSGIANKKSRRSLIESIVRFEDAMLAEMRRHPNSARWADDSCVKFYCRAHMKTDPIPQGIWASMMEALEKSMQRVELVNWDTPSEQLFGGFVSGNLRSLYP